MKILLDTHVFLWAIMEPDRLSASMRRRFVDSDNELFLSTASIWEIGTKYVLKKLPLAVEPGILVPQQMKMQGILPLPLNMEHALQAHQLPLHHRDPFDRMIVAQARVEAMPIMSADPALKAYGVRILA